MVVFKKESFLKLESEVTAHDPAADEFFRHGTDPCNFTDPGGDDSPPAQTNFSGPVVAGTSAPAAPVFDSMDIQRVLPCPQQPARSIGDSPDP